MNVRRTTLAGIAIAVTSLLVAACGSSSSGSSPSASPSGSSPSASASASASATGSPIVIGNIGAYSGSQASSEGGAEQVLKAWAQSVNDSGGIAGHPLDLIVKDIGNDATGGLAAAKELVQQDHVVAIVGEQDNADSTWGSYIASTGVPVIGGLSINVPFATNPDFFPAGTNIFAAIYGLLVNAKAAGGKLGVLYCAEAPQCAQAAPLFSALGQVVGVTVPFETKVSATAPDYTGVCQKLKDSGVQSYIVGSGSAVVVRIAQACSKLGVTAKQLNTDGTATSNWASVPEFDGALVTEVDVPFVDTTTPGGQAYQALLAKYLPKLGDANGPDAEYSFVAGKLFEKAAAAAGADVTAASLKTALYSLKGETLDGLAPPLTFTQGAPTEVNCYFTLGISGGKFTEPKGATTACAPDAVISGLLAQLAKSAG